MLRVQAMLAGGDRNGAQALADSYSASHSDSLRTHVESGGSPPERSTALTSRRRAAPFIQLTFATCSITACTVQADLGGGIGQTDTSQAGLTLPLEVLGSGSPDEPVVVKAQLSVPLSAVPNVQALYVQCHRCGFYGPPEFETLAKPLTPVKASLRIDGDAGRVSDTVPWLDITDSNVVVDPVSAAHGGINGALVTVGFRVPIDDQTRARLVDPASEANVY